MKVVLKKLNWPNEIKASATAVNDLIQLKAAFKRLSVFQDLPEFSSSGAGSAANGPVPSLLPFRIMATDVDIRFRYHFESNRPTNNIEKVLSLLYFTNISAGVVLPKHSLNNRIAQ